MEGIRILAEIPIYITEYSWGWSWLGLGLGIASLFFFTAIIILLRREDPDGWLFSIFFIILLLGSLFCFGTKNSVEVFDHMKYKVLISEEVNFIELNEKYEIINQEGEIFTIIEKPQD